MTLKQIDALRLKRLLRPFRGRRVDFNRPVDVYRNLARGGYSVRQGGHIVAHCGAIMLMDVSFVVSVAGWRRSVALGKKTVHAVARGMLTGSGMGTLAGEAWKLPRIRYDQKIGAFVHNLTVLPARRRVVRGARVIALNSRGCFGAYFR